MLRMVSHPHRPQSGHIMCYLNRTYHVLPTPGRNFFVSHTKKAYDARGESCGLPPASCLSRLSSNRTRIVVPVLELFRTSVPRSDIALARISVLTPYHVSVCVDGEYTTAYSWH